MSDVGNIDVSVVIAARDETVYVESAVQSILAQQDINLEVIFVDDNSSDDTLEKVRKIAAEDNRLKVFSNPEPGKARAFSYGIAQASGRFMCLFAADDLMPQHSLKARYDSIKDHADDCVVGLSKLQTMSEDPHFDGMVTPKGEGRGGFTGVSYLMSAKAIERLFPIPSELPNEDTWIEACLIYLPEIKLMHCDVISCLWRVHSGNSINMQVPFKDYNAKLTPRMAAFKILYDRFAETLPEEKRKALKGRVDCETARAKGSVFGVLLSGTTLVERLRALSATNSFFYGLRKRLFKILSGF